MEDATVVFATVATPDVPRKKIPSIGVYVWLEVLGSDLGADGCRDSYSYVKHGIASGK